MGKTKSSAQVIARVVEIRQQIAALQVEYDQLVAENRELLCYRTERIPRIGIDTYASLPPKLRQVCKRIRQWVVSKEDWHKLATNQKQAFARRGIEPKEHWQKKPL